jgi:hypothetical protein
MDAGNITHGVSRFFLQLRHTQTARCRARLIGDVAGFLGLNSDISREKRHNCRDTLSNTHPLTRLFLIGTRLPSSQSEYYIIIPTNQILWNIQIPSAMKLLSCIVVLLLLSLFPLQHSCSLFEGVYWNILISRLIKRPINLFPHATSNQTTLSHDESSLLLLHLFTET